MFFSDLGSLEELLCYSKETGNGGCEATCTAVLLFLFLGQGDLKDVVSFVDGYMNRHILISKLNLCVQQLDALESIGPNKLVRGDLGSFQEGSEDSVPGGVGIPPECCVSSFFFFFFLSLKQKCIDVHISTKKVAPDCSRGSLAEVVFPAEARRRDVDLRKVVSFRLGGCCLQARLLANRVHEFPRGSYPLDGSISLQCED